VHRVSCIVYLVRADAFMRLWGVHEKGASVETSTCGRADAWMCGCWSMRTRWLFEGGSGEERNGRGFKVGPEATT